MRDENASFGKLVQFWPLIMVVGAGVAGYLKLSFTVDQLASQSEQRAKSIDVQRDIRNSEMENIRIRLTKLEDWREVRKVPD